MDENLDLFRRMRAGEFPNGTRVLRAKISIDIPRDVGQHQSTRSGDVILHASHPRTGTQWKIYPVLLGPVEATPVRSSRGSI